MRACPLSQERKAAAEQRAKAAAAAEEKAIEKLCSTESTEEQLNKLKARARVYLASVAERDRTTMRKQCNLACWLVL